MRHARATARVVRQADEIAPLGTRVPPRRARPTPPRLLALACAIGVAGCHGRESPSAPRPSEPPPDVSFDFCSAAKLPLWFAYQDGSGAWTTLAPQGTTFTFPLGAMRGGVAYVVRSAPSAVQLVIRYLGRDELLRQHESCAAVPSVPPSQTASGQVLGVGSGDEAEITLGNWRATIDASSGTFTVPAPSGANDLVAVLRDFLYPQSPRRMVLRHGVTVAGGGVIPTIDFGGTEAFDLVPHTLTLTDLGSDGVQNAVLSYFTESDSAGTLLGFPPPLTNGNQLTFFGVPAARQGASDLHYVGIGTVPRASAHGQSRVVELWLHHAVDGAVSFGPGLPALSVASVAGAPYVRLRASGLDATSQDSLLLAYTDGSQPVQHLVLITASAGYVAAGPTPSLETPDFTGRTGWDPTWAPQSGRTLTWSVKATNKLDGPITDGTIRRWAFYHDTLTP